MDDDQARRWSRAQTGGGPDPQTPASPTPKGEATQGGRERRGREEGREGKGQEEGGRERGEPKGGEQVCCPLSCNDAT